MIATSPISQNSCPPRISETGDDYCLHERVIQGLRNSGYSSLSKIKCEVFEGEVAVIGVVPSFYLKQMAQTIILRIGQIKVKNNLKVQSHCDPESSAPDGQDLSITKRPGYEAA
jgi:hypothetical protein